jgi:hypothetical protein
VSADALEDPHVAFAVGEAIEVALPERRPSWLATATARESPPEPERITGPVRLEVLRSRGRPMANVLPWPRLAA